MGQGPRGGFMELLYKSSTGEPIIKFAVHRRARVMRMWVGKTYRFAVAAISRIYLSALYLYLGQQRG